MSKLILGPFGLILALVVFAYGQEAKTTTQIAQQPTTQTTQPATETAQQPTTQTTQPTTENTQQPTTATTQQTTATSTYDFPDKSERFRRYVKGTIGPFRLAYTGVTAGLQQWGDNPEEWGQGMEGYGRRYASSLGRNAIQQTVTYGLDSALKLDTGFQRSEREGFFLRLKDALLANITSRTRSGKRVISAPRLAGVYAGGVIAAETWYPERYSYKDGLRTGTRTLLTGFGINLVREFVFNW